MGRRRPDYSKVTLLRNLPGYIHIAVAHPGVLPSKPLKGTYISDFTTMQQSLNVYINRQMILSLKSWNMAILKQASHISNTLGSLQVMIKVRV